MQLRQVPLSSRTANLPRTEGTGARWLIHSLQLCEQTNVLTLLRLHHSQLLSFKNWTSVQKLSTVSADTVQLKISVKIYQLICWYMQTNPDAVYLWNNHRCTTPASLLFVLELLQYQSFPAWLLWTKESMIAIINLICSFFFLPSVHCVCLDTVNTRDPRSYEHIEAVEVQLKLFLCACGCVKVGTNCTSWSCTFRSICIWIMTHLLLLLILGGGSAPSVSVWVSLLRRFLSSSFLQSFSLCLIWQAGTQNQRQHRED